MPISNGYVTLDQVKEEIQLTKPDSDPRLERIATAISRLVDNHCGFPWRRFYADAADVTRYFDPTERESMKIMDLKTITSLAIDTDGDGVFEETWTLDTDFILTPHNAAADSRPFTAVEIPRASGKCLPVGVPKSVRIIGKWGWPAVPTEVTEACLLEIARRHKRKDAPFGIANPAAQDGPAMRLTLIDVDAKKLLKNLVRPMVAVGGRD